MWTPRTSPERTHIRPDILIVEPDPLRQTFLCAALATRGYSVLACADGSAASELLGREPFRLVLIDSGQVDQVMGRQIREISAGLPLIVLVALPDSVVAHMADGRNPPPDLPDLLEALTRYMRSAPWRPEGMSTAPSQLLKEWAVVE
jgi:CheY-like chemotaxis protein